MGYNVKNLFLQKYGMELANAFVTTGNYSMTVGPDPTGNGAFTIMSHVGVWSSEDAFNDKKEPMDAIPTRVTWQPTAAELQVLDTMTENLYKTLESTYIGKNTAAAAPTPAPTPAAKTARQKAR